MPKLKKPEFFIDNKLADLYTKAELDLKNNNNLLKLGEALNAREFSNEAKNVLEKLIKNDPKSNLGWYELIFAAGYDEELMSGLIEKSNKIFKDKNNYLNQRNQALINHYLGKTEEAGQHCQAIADLKKKDFSIFEVCAYLRFWENDYKSALKQVKKSLEIKPKSIRSWRLLGHCHFELGEYKKAEDAYRKSVEIDEFYLRGWYSLGQLILNDPERYKEGLQALSHTISINPNYWNTYFTLINFYLGNKRYAEAIAECNRIISLDPPENVLIEAHSYHGLLHYTSGEFRIAEGSFKSVLELKPDYAIAQYYLGQISFKSNNFDAALEYFEKSLECDPSFVWPYTQSGFVLLEKKETAKAQARFEQALQLDPKEYWAYMGLADIYRVKRKSKLQLEAILKAVEIEPNDSDVQNRLAIAYECNNNPDLAEQAYKNSLDIDPLNRKAANNLGYFYEKLFDKTKDASYKEKAIEAWKRRLLICRDTNSSMKGAINHLLKLNVRQSLIDKWVEIGKIQENNWD